MSAPRSAVPDETSAAIGVVIATRDRRETLLRTLGRLTALPERPPVVVVDNASSDGSPAAVRRRHPAVRVIELDDNIGAAARTVGVEALDTPLVAFNDDDSWWATGALSRAAAVFGAHPRLALLAARILVGAENRMDPTCLAMRDSPLGREPDLPGPSVLGFVACASIVRRAAYLSVGGFSPALSVGGEEDLLALDLAAAGWRLAYVADVVAHHHPPGPAHGPSRARAELRNALMTAWMRRRPLGAARRSAGVAATALRHRQAGVLVDVVRQVGWLRAKRRPVPRPVERAARTLERAG